MGLWDRDDGSRFIPTCVGNTAFAVRTDEVTAVHPHVCGEYSAAGALSIEDYRFIPTCVGNTVKFLQQFFRVCGSSPRVWGILAVDVCHSLLERGSSPRVWGILWTQQSWETLRRFIPTCVGNTVFVCVEYVDNAVHPHVCGEYSLGEKSNLRKDRFIPTCVGNTATNNTTALSETVHPHVCGEYGRAAEYVTGLDGSSPRVWGIRDPSVCSLRPQSGSSPRVWGILIAHSF